MIHNINMHQKKGDVSIKSSLKDLRKEAQPEILSKDKDVNWDNVTVLNLHVPNKQFQDL